MKLVIVESPAKCQKIQGFLGPGYKVIASMGHIRALEEDLDAVGLDRDFEAKFQFQKDKLRAITALKDAAQGVDQVYLAADDDREGEAIAYSVALLLKLPIQTTPRAVFHEITEKAVKAAIANPRTIDVNRVNAQQARAILDMMVGFTISPLLWKHIGHALSAGRCQTPALRLVVEKEREIRGFKSSHSWRVRGEWQAKSGLVLQANMTEDLEDEESALNYLENIHSDLAGHITQADTRPWTESSPKPLITSTLQQEASALYRSNPKGTMQAAQRLYEAGHITYMRTDKAVLSEEAITAAQAWVRANFGAEYLGHEVLTQETPAPAPKKKKGSQPEPKEAEKPKAQEAHEAIRPTHFENRQLPTTEDWSATDKKIYMLIWNRAVQSIMASATGETRKVTLRADEDPCEFDWQTQFKRTTFQGWRRLGNTAVLDETDETVDSEESLWKQATQLQKGSQLTWTSLEANPHETKPTTRYTEATLVRELEKKGIGRPSTFAMLLSAIQDKEYAKKEDKPAQKVERTKYTLQPMEWPATKATYEQSMGAEKDKLVPTSLGERVMQFCVEKFSDLFDYGFTAQMETRLDTIAEGNEHWKQVLRDTWNSYKDRYQTLKTAEGTVEGRSKKFGEIKAVQGKKGPILLIEDPSGDKEKTQFLGWPEGKTYETITQEDVDEFMEAKKDSLAQASVGTLDGKPMIKKSGPFGQYIQWGDVRLSVKGTESIEELEKALKEKGATTLHVLGPFEFRKGQYGLYMFKKDIKDRKFVGLPEGCDPKKLTVEEAVKLYQTGLQNKAKASAYASASPQQGGGTRGGGRGGFRGRGRGRGRGGHA